MSDIVTVRAFWNRRPCNIRHSPKPVGSREYFDEVEKRKYFVEPHIPRLAEFKRWEGKQVLEIGCGIGTDTINFARAGAFITAIDVSEESLKLAKKRAELFWCNHNINFFCGNAEELTSFAPVKEYDLVYAFGSIHHTPYPERVISEVRRVIAKDGEFRLMLYHRYSWKVLSMLFRNIVDFQSIDELVARYSEAESGCPITFSYSRRTARELLKGFRITDIQIEHIFPYRVQDYVQYRYVKEWYFRFMPRFIFRALERTLGWHLLIKAVPV